MKPTLTHFIGISGETKNKYSKEIEKFLSNYYEEDLISVSKEAILNSIYSEELKSYFNKKFVYDVISDYNTSSINLFGMRPPFHLNESHLYNHEMIWCLLETEMLSPQIKALKIPYENFNKFIGEKSEVLNKEIEDKNVIRQLKCYDGIWARQYANFSLYHFDADFDFILDFFNVNGIPIEKNELDRYIVFEWA